MGSQTDKIFSWLFRPKYLFFTLFGVNLYALIVHIILTQFKTNFNGSPFLTPTYFYGYIVCNFLILAFMVKNKFYVLKVFKQIEQWVNFPDFRYQRKLISGILLSILLIYCLKIHIGFYFWGIAGWIEAPFKDSNFPGKVKSKNSEYPEYLLKTVMKDNIPYLPHTQSLIRLNVQFLHFGDTVLPTNYDITPYVFDHVLINTLKKNQKIGLLKPIFKKGFNDKRNRLGWLYPNHSPFMDIDYSSYPDAEKLTGFSAWYLSLVINKETEKVDILWAGKEYEFSFN